jgi:hypothetical protein
MRLPLSTAAMLTIVCVGAMSKVSAEPLVTISCEKPNGVSISYGTPLQERLEAKEKNQPEQPPTLKEPEKSGYAALPTFVIDSNKKKVTVIWSELPKDEEGKKGIERAWTIPPPPATDATVVLFTDDQISAIEADLWSITTYSFFPKTGSAFIGQQATQPGTKNAIEVATFAHCQFSFSNQKDDPAKKH